MRINGFQNIPAILQSFQAGKSSQAAPASGGASDSEVSLSSFAEILQTLQRQVAKEAQARDVRVAELGQQIQSGQFNVDTTKIAEKLMNLGVLDIKD